MSKRRRPAISYSRFSDPYKQKDGDSEDRQARAFQAFCEARNLVPRGEPLVDRGLSAYKMLHRDKGKFGLFLQAIQEGLVEKDAVLVVEALDRLSRAKPHESMNLAADILKAGVDIGVVTLGEIFTEADLGGPKAHTLWMFFWLAHQESKQKAERIGESWKKRRALAREKGKLMSKRLPAWLEAVHGQLRPIPERVAVVQRIFRLAIEGHGHKRIVGTLHKEEIPPFSRAGKWTVPYITHILNDQRVLGNLKVKEGDMLRAYYPAIVTEQDYALARAAQGERSNGGANKKRFRDNKYVNLFRSLLVHARDGEGFFLNNRGTNKDPRLVLVSAAGGNGRVGTYTFPYPVFETAVLTLLREVDPAEVLEGGKSGPGPVDTLRARLSNLRDDIASIKADIKAKYSRQLSEVLREQEEDQERLQEQLADELARAARPARQAFLQLPKLIDLIAQEGDAARLKLRPVLRRVIEAGHVLTVRRRSWILLAVQFFLAEGLRRDYLVVYQSAGCGRPGGWRAWSLADALEAGTIDLRKPQDAAKLEQVLQAVDVSVLWQLPEEKG
jgi:DNA invertase Pin-like site-specific DNA recombinase